MLTRPLRSPLSAPATLPIRYDVSSDALLARMTTAPSLSRRAAIDTLIKNMKGCGAWAAKDAFYVFAAHDAQAARLNWIQDAYNITTGGGAPTFSANSHYVGNGTTDWLDTNFNPATAVGAKWTQDNMHIAVWSLTDLDNAAARDDVMGNASAFIARSAGVATQASYRANRSSTSLISGAFPGYIVARRTDSNTFSLFANGVGIHSGSAVSTQTSANLRILGGGGSGVSVNQVRFASFGRRLLTAEIGPAYRALSAYNGAL